MSEPYAPGPGWADSTQRCENCRRWARFSLAQGYCELPGDAFAPIMLSDGGGLQTHPNHYCIAWAPIEPQTAGEAS